MIPVPVLMHSPILLFHDAAGKVKVKVQCIHVVIIVTLLDSFEYSQWSINELIMSIRHACPTRMTVQCIMNLGS